ncbi:MAG: TIGR04086 family membrane protein [Clostridia bacterium]|nr:TIGR04086 family membrane protein [Clostridia bacterium]
MEKTFKESLLGVLKGVLIGVSICLAGVLVFAFVLKFTSLSQFWIKTVNQIIKLIAVTVACITSVRGKRGFLKGAVVGFGVVFVTFFLFGLISGGLSFGWGTLLEAVYGILIGLIGGILAVNLKKPV